APDADARFTYLDRRAVLDAAAHDSTGRRVLRGSATLPYDLAFTRVEGSRRLEGPLTASVVLDSLSLAALPLRSRSLDDVRGRVDGHLQVSGTWRAPEYRGRAALRDGGLQLLATEMKVTDAVADLSFTGDT